MEHWNIGTFFSNALMPKCVNACPQCFQLKLMQAGVDAFNFKKFRPAEQGPALQDKLHND